MAAFKARTRLTPDRMISIPQNIISALLWKEKDLVEIKVIRGAKNGKLIIEKLKPLPEVAQPTIFARPARIKSGPRLLKL